MSLKVRNHFCNNCAKIALCFLLKVYWVDEGYWISGPKLVHF